MRPLEIFFIWSVVFVSTNSEMSIYKAGWLDRLVQYFKEKFVADVHEKLPPIKFEASIVKAPPGYVDSKKWDYDSVLRLLQLIRSNRKTRPLATALRRSLNPALRNGRRSSYNNYRMFPKHPSDHDVYYTDSEYESESDDGPDDLDGQDGRLQPEDVEDDAVVLISNPVEARLPSAHISVRMLRSILEERALAARIMPPTTTTTILWKVHTTKTVNNDTAKNDTAASNASSDNSSNPDEGGGGGNSTDDANGSGGNGSA